MRALNRVELIGNLGSDPEVRYTAAGDAVATVSIATSESWTDKQSGDIREQTEWHRCVFWRRLGEIAGQYLTKGSRIYVSGSLKTRKWQDQSGQDRYTTEVQVRDMIMLDGNPKGQSQKPGPQTDRAGRMAPDHEASYRAQEPAEAGDFDDDIPF